MSHCDLLYKHLNKLEARKLLTMALAEMKAGRGFIYFTSHVKKRLVERKLNSNDIMNVLAHGSLKKEGEPHIKTGQLIYNVETERMEVSFQFLDKIRIRVITIKRKGAVR